MDNRTLAGIKSNIPKDLNGKVIWGSNYDSQSKKWSPKSNKLTKLEIFSSVLDVEKMIEYTKGEGCVDDGDYLSWDSMQWSLHGVAKIEHKEAGEICRLQRLAST